MEAVKPIKLSFLGEDPESFRKKFPFVEVLDSYKDQLKELFLVRNPRFKFHGDYEAEWLKFLLEQFPGKNLDACGEWFYFPWNKQLVHYLDEDSHLEARTARNRNIITSAEQKKLYQSSVAVAGLSVGSHAALTIVLMGMAKNIKLADPDSVAISNLNRIRADVSHININKCELAARQIYQINPYANVGIFSSGVNDSNLSEFLAGAQVLVEEIDNLLMKIKIRFTAKEKRVPVVMATDNGHNVIIDIERYDLRPDLKIFNGAVGDLTLEEFEKFSPRELPRLATKIAGPELIAARMQDSLLEVGKTIYSWPQTGDAATLAGVGVAHAVKRLLLGESLREGKMEINLDAIFDSDYNTKEAKQSRAEKLGGFLAGLNLG